ncbi:MAG: hypothetical protein F4061_03395 [Acidobacteria bacterium]|nr:hypothetical protein [Acidobacteriota bacterium]
MPDPTNGALKDAGAAVRRPRTFRVLALLFGVLLALVCLETVARVLPVNEGPQALSVNDANPIFRYRPNREFVWSAGWNFSAVNEVKVNNFGFVNDQDYDPDGTGALLAVIGDSFVEAFRVPFEHTCHGRLAARLNGTARVYSFGASGAPLSQYLAYAGYVRDTFRPAGLAIVIIDNDFDQSLAKYGLQRGKHQFVERGGGRLALERSDLEFRPRYRLVRGSALARYVAINLGMARERNYRLFTGEDPDARVSEADRATWVVDSKRAVDAFLDMLPAASGLEPERIMFIVDGIRPRVYGSDVPEWEKGVYREDVGYVDAMRRYFIENVVRRGYETIDLEPAFAAHYRLHRTQFDWLPLDEHWNALGHDVCSEAAAGSELLRELKTRFSADAASPAP